MSERLVHVSIPAPTWLKSVNLETASTPVIGSGPYLLADYRKGQYLLFKANENYGGTPKPTIAEGG